MTVARSVADVLAEHVSFEVECIDRMVRHEALCVRVEVRDLHRQAVAAV
jgi:hypothetical protein